MRVLPRIGLSLLLATIAAPAVALDAQQARPQGREQFAGNSARDEGYRQGLRVGEDHGRRGQPLNFSIALEYRQGDLGFRYGDRNRYRADFRVGFEQGYRESYSRWGNDRDRRGRADLAADTGYRDGYDEGLNDGRHNHRNDPVAESRFRNGDHGYQRWYGPREVYKANYRDAFRAGYERGYRDGRYIR